MNCVVAFILFFSCSIAFSSNELLLDGINKFGFELIEQIGSNNRGNENILICPYSISSAFSIVFPGSMDSTQQQIANTLHYPTPYNSVFNDFEYYNNDLESRYNGNDVMSLYGEFNSTNPFILINNRIFADNQFIMKQSYIDIVDGYMERIDLDNESYALNIINDFIYDSTNGLIEDSVKEIPQDSKLIAVNTIYLNGSWENNFESAMTSESNFYSDVSRSNQLTAVHLMHKINYFDYYESNQFQFIKLPVYGDSNNNANHLFLLIALPKTQQDKLSDITYETLKDAIFNLESNYIALAIPKISIIQSVNGLKSKLESLGMIVPFTQFANFSNMTNTRDIQITDIIHQTALNTDENGIEAAAATVITVGITGIEESILFRADHPFSIFIIDNSYSNLLILFMGDIVYPGIPSNSIAVYDESIDPIWLSTLSNIVTTKSPTTQSPIEKKHSNYWKKFKKWIKSIIKKLRS